LAVETAEKSDEAGVNPCAAFAVAFFPEFFACGSCVPVHILVLVARPCSPYALAQGNELIGFTERGKS